MMMIEGASNHKLAVHAAETNCSQTTFGGDILHMKFQLNPKQSNE